MNDETSWIFHCFPKILGYSKSKSRKMQKEYGNLRYVNKSIVPGATYEAYAAVNISIDRLH